VELVVSQELLNRAGVDLGVCEQHEVAIRGRKQSLVRAVKNATALTAMSSSNKWRGCTRQSHTTPQKIRNASGFAATICP
jgi:hypothetical protein